eukprot:9037142-Pyramimonas_sp.AAC.1
MTSTSGIQMVDASGMEPSRVSRSSTPDIPDDEENLHYDPHHAKPETPDDADHYGSLLGGSGSKGLEVRKSCRRVRWGLLSDPLY